MYASGIGGDFTPVSGSEKNLILKAIFLLRKTMNRKAKHDRICIMVSIV